jgi:hypothetical protein
MRNPLLAQEQWTVPVLNIDMEGDSLDFLNFCAYAPTMVGTVLIHLRLVSD